MKKFNANDWAHLACVNWTEEIYYLDEKKDKINVENINFERFDLKCMFCGIKKGSCIQVN